MNWLDGPRLAAWLRARGVRNKDIDAGGSTLSKWASGQAVREDTADHYLVRLGLHLSQLPDDIWVTGPHKNPVRYQAVQDYMAGDTALLVAARYGVARQTVYRWAAEEGVRKQWAVVA